ncbi:septum formation initiator family protein [Brevibacillus sp. 7WMA2]|uniref:Cell division protein DivIC n=1 Tax=Brevibacillus laterosporus LMG 15441 TaxID=1042163 RepID=A0A075QZ71_BRELA|nr:MULTISPECIES: septum formation initiator family protein [Brevibacillus]AIG24501.1 cell division protein DivIC [Brevibacillus laterosporus LMG 15441]AUM63148.1 cell division protein [Brevibacillus laterosporus]AYK06175.1 septum formation initiator family protein [Brevibacillus laterosporus]ERM16231.1 cell division protein [Brevibacillus laterosporus PE36]MBA4534298.1 septum formation initiator family protein [Brevibacillus halotolerans]
MAKERPSQSNNLGRKRRLRFIMFFVFCFLIWTCYTAYLQSSVIAETEEQVEALQKEAGEVKEQQEELTNKMKRLDDPEYIAELARKNNFMSKPGEIIFLIPDN